MHRDLVNMYADAFDASILMEKVRVTCTQAGVSRASGAFCRASHKDKKIDTMCELNSILDNVSAQQGNETKH